MHGLWCGAKTFPLSCRYCGKPIFLFTCNCGSVALFDALGAPWPKHWCGHARGPDDGEGPTYGLDPAHASHIVRAFAELNGLPVPPLEWESDLAIDEAVARRAASPPAIVRVEPADREARVVGVVSELVPSVDPVRKLDIRGKLFVQQVLRHVPGRVSQITVLDGAEPRGSYTAWLDPRGGGASDLRRGALVSFHLRPVKLPALEAFWVVLSFEFLA